MSHKKVIRNQKYEEYWKITLGTSDIFGNQFIRTLALIVDHIDKYDLANKTVDELKKGKTLNQEVTHSKDLEAKIKSIYENDDSTGASTRKQINQYIKLGFVKPYLQGYHSAAKEYIKPGQSEETLQRLFSDTVYQYASFNSNRTKADPFNQIKFLVQTILNRKNKCLTADELIGLMNDTQILSQKYAREKDIQIDKKWAESIDFKARKYNQISYVCNILSKMSLFRVSGRKLADKIIMLADHAPEYFPEPGDTTRDTYRFSLMKKAVYDESIRLYGKKICWLTKKESMGLVVSHLYASAEALRKYDNDAAYDPQNALLLAPGNPDQYLDKYKMTFDMDGNPIFADDDDSMFVQEVENNHYKIDKKIMTPDRQHYMKIHNKYFEKKNNQKIN
ncbi:MULTISPECIES: restriction endonuclease [Lactobacillus]|uniref:restriction endonuclease n=2 Tax=Lactobacillaceae TaxID=33958 RepID=UPI000B5DAEA8|nr:MULTISPECIES: restriction endonuclease [Lactobacillus]PEH11159.1 restriction endonuclease [Lactobacillus sp. UMNPBX1]